LAGALEGVVMVAGSDGMLGTDLTARLRRLEDETPALRVVPLVYPPFDMTRPEVVERTAASIRPDWIFNMAAYTDVDGAESNAEAAWAANSDGPAWLAEAAADHGARLVHVSTGFVFDGSKTEPYTEDDPVGPNGVYAESKAAGDQRVRETLPGRHLIVRTGLLYGAGGRSFPGTMLRLGRERSAVDVVSDQRGSPTWTADLAEMILALAGADARGTYHAVNAGSATWYEWAKAIFEMARLAAVVRPIPARDFKRAAPVPANSTLATAKLTEAAGIVPRHWKAALREYLGTPPHTG
jgi:dTDP-4-dehydrorhamnose reductase/4-ketoreductase